MKVVVTGGSGRVGQVTLRALVDAGHEVVLLDSRPAPDDSPKVSRFIQAGADHYPAILDASAGADAIIHLAGIPGPRDHAPHVIHNNNVTASYNVLCAAVECGVPRVIQASSVNAIGASWSREPEFDYLPVDEHHATRNEDAYSLSKWLGEQQADSIVRLHPEVSIASMRLHMFMQDRADAVAWSTGDHSAGTHRGLWGYTTHQMWTDACLLALTADFTGHERFFIIADRSVVEDDSESLARTYFPEAELRQPMPGNQGFFDCNNAKRILRWSGAD